MYLYCFTLAVCMQSGVMRLGPHTRADKALSKLSVVLEESRCVWMCGWKLM